MIYPYSMRNFILIIQLLLAASCLQSCETLLVNPAPREKKIVQTYNLYGYVAEGNKEMLMNEPFNNNNRLWSSTFTTTQSHIFVGNGLLNMMASSSGPLISTTELSTFTGNTNFEIECLMQIERDRSGGGNRIIWGYDLNSKKYNYLEINNYSDLISVGRFDGNVTTKNTVEMYDWDGDYYYQGYNKFTIRKVNNMYYYFINDTFIYQEPFSSFAGTRMGLQVGTSNELNVEWLTVKKLNL
jgi:hypothetical protein